MVRVLIVDNDDSFTYNIVELVRGIGGCRFAVVNWRRVHPRDVSRFSHMILSPGPGRVEEYTRVVSLLDSLSLDFPVLGICLGHQLLAWRAGATLERLVPPVHGQAHWIQPVRSHWLFDGLSSPFRAGLYHSWTVDFENIPSEVEVLAFSQGGKVMAIRLRGTMRVGVQFHPESHLTPQGQLLMQNFLKWSGG